MTDFPKPPDRRQLSLPSKSGLILQLKERDAAQKRQAEELEKLERELMEEKEQVEAKRLEVETRFRALTEGELLFKNQKLLHQKQVSRLLEQNELVALRTELEKREDDFKKKEAFFTQTEKRLNEQYTRLDTNLSNLNSLQNYVTQQIASWNRSTGR